MRKTKKEYNKTYWDKHKNEVNKSRAMLSVERKKNRNQAEWIRKKKRLIFIREIKASRGCKTCGETDFRCLQFHHKDPSIKLFGISRGYTRSMKNLLAEIEKCEVLCSNCHDKLHFDFLDLS